MSDNVYGALIPPGTYYLGDCSHTLAAADWEALINSQPRLNGAGELNGYDINGRPVVALGAVNIAGTYQGSDGISYPVEAGVIALVHQDAACPIKAAAALADGKVKLVTFEQETTVSNDQGLMVFGDITIDTTGGGA